jgi:hypothetical protein
LRTGARAFFTWLHGGFGREQVSVGTVFHVVSHHFHSVEIHDDPVVAPAAQFEIRLRLRRREPVAKICRATVTHLLRLADAQAREARTIAKSTVGIIRIVSGMPFGIVECRLKEGLVKSGHGLLRILSVHRMEPLPCGVGWNQDRPDGIPSPSDGSRWNRASDRRYVGTGGCLMVLA